MLAVFPIIVVKEILLNYAIGGMKPEGNKMREQGFASPIWCHHLSISKFFALTMLSPTSASSSGENRWASRASCHFFHLVEKPNRAYLTAPFAAPSD